MGLHIVYMGGHIKIAKNLIFHHISLTSSVFTLKKQKIPNSTIIVFKEIEFLKSNRSILWDFFFSIKLTDQK